MSCGPGKPCEEGRKRRIAFGALGAMTIIFLLLSAASFLGSRRQVTPDAVHFGAYNAVQGKRVFQAYNCMGCHTMLGNGAYLGPDLTNVYETAGPAGRAAFLPSAGGWPTGPALQVHLQKPEQVAANGAGDLAAYLKRYPGAAERVQRRGGGATFMPNLPLTSEQVGQLIAFFKYTSQMDTEGWPPKPKVDGLKSPQARPIPGIATANAAEAPAAGTSVAAADPAARGAEIVKEYGCIACHALDRSQRVGPGWGGLYDSQVALIDGSHVLADDAFLAESIREPNAKVAAGHVAGTMPAYATMLDDDQVNAIVAYIRTLPGDGQ
jgi:mono/diheme cytochrome c family protein